ncbi:MAG: hypothetical protein KJO21_05930 [Verrucomicrobiae bacterium]|nr:hypothetical protein [Verrucomicrobiae bacterium]NNJ43715.1 hypothetical protein [Akkermansiaceae bacterium]
MKSKPLTIAIAAILLVIAIFLIIASNHQDDPATRDHTGTPPEQGNQARDNRTPQRQPTPATSMKWEEKIDFVLGSDSISNEKATRLLLGIVLDADAPISVRNDALEHALNLVDDEDFQLIQSVMGSKNKELPEPLIQTILDDTLNRPDTIQLTTALKVIQGTHTQVIDEAVELLEFHLELEHGNNIEQWTQAVDRYTAQNKQ